MNLKVVLLSILMPLCLYYCCITYCYTISELQYENHIKNKVILITGASSGIGEEITYQLSDLGAKLVIVARTESKLARVKQHALERGSPRVETIIYDFANDSGSPDVTREAVRRMGTIDHAILNHAAAPLSSFLSTPQQQHPHFIYKIFRVNLFSHIQMMLSLLPILEGSAGHVFVSSSLFGEVPVFIQFMSAILGSSKHALNGFFYSLQQELLAKQSNVTVTVGNIGLVMTKELQVLLADLNIPDITKGDLGTCAGRIIETLITRQRTLNYPFLATLAQRYNFQFNPWFHEVMVKSRGSYDKAVSKQEKILQKRDVLLNDYQRGYMNVDNDRI